MHAMPIVWKVGGVLKTHNITGYQFWKASGLPKRSAYRVVNGDSRNFNTDTLDATVRALRALTSKQLTICDLLEYVEEGAQ